MVCRGAARIKKKNRCQPAAVLSVSKKSHRVCRLRWQIDSKRFLPGRVPGRKHFSGRKCGICPPVGDKLCARQTAKTCRKAPKGFFDSLNRCQPAAVFAFFTRRSPWRRPSAFPGWAGCRGSGFRTDRSPHSPMPSFPERCTGSWPSPPDHSAADIPGTGTHWRC